MMKRMIAILLAAVLTAALLCACNGAVHQQPTVERDLYIGTYVYQNTTMREISTRTVTVNADGTYTYTRVSSMEEKNGDYSGTWTVDEEGSIVFTGSISGKTSKGTLSEDTLKLNIADVGHGEDTIGSGIYLYQFPEDSTDTADAG